MEFRAPAVAAQKQAEALSYFTKNLTDQEAGRAKFEDLVKELGNVVDRFPDWHPILTAPNRGSGRTAMSISDLDVYDEADHTRYFVRGFVTCPYSKVDADRLVQAVSEVQGLHAYRLDTPLYADNAYPVVVEAIEVALDADGTIRSRNALVWFTQLSAQEAEASQVAETWWNIRLNILGAPHGSRSSLFVSQHTGVHMRKILEAMNGSGMFGPIKESSLDMLSPKKRTSISENLIRTAVNNWDKASATFEFELCGETCKASMKDTWKDGEEISVQVMIGKYDLFIQGHFYPKNHSITHQQPRGKRELAEKFL